MKATSNESSNIAHLYNKGNKINENDGETRTMKNFFQARFIDIGFGFN